MYDDLYNKFPSDRPLSSYEIELRARRLEKQYALMNAMNRSQSSTGLFAGIWKVTRRIAGMVGGLFA